MLAYESGLQGATGGKTVLNILQANTNLSAPFITSVKFISKRQQNLITNYTIEELSILFFRNYPLQRMLHFKMKYLADGALYQSLTIGSVLHEKRDNRAREGFDYVVNNVKLGLLQDIYQFDNDSLLNLPVSDVMKRYMGMRNEEIAQHLDRKPSFHIMQARSIAQLVESFTVTNGMTLKDVVSQLHNYREKCKCLYIFVFQ